MTNSNGLGFSPDRKTMYHADTAAHRVSRYDYDAATGAVDNQRLLHQFSTDKTHNYGGRPDGAAVDSEGNYWVAMFEGARIAKLSPSGELLGEIALPVRCPTMPAFGGPDLRTLYVTSAGARPAPELEQYPLSGKLLAISMDVAGRAEPAYKE
jgi:sugar lactone lactonase YvrE